MDSQSNKTTLGHQELGTPSRARVNIALGNGDPFRTELYCSADRAPFGDVFVGECTLTAYRPEELRRLAHSAISLADELEGALECHREPRHV